MILIVKAQIGETGPVVTIRGRDAWALLELKAANDNGCTPIDHPGPRWSGYVHKLRKSYLEVPFPLTEGFAGLNIGRRRAGLADQWLVHHLAGAS